MLVKYLESLKNSSDEDLVILANSAFHFYINNHKESLNSIISSDLEKKKAFSTLVRFFRSINSNKKLDEEVISSNLKETLKGKNALITNLTEKILEIASIQMKRINYADKSPQSLYNISLKKSSYVDSVLDSIKTLQNFSWRINVTISNIYSNRVSSII